MLTDEEITLFYKGFDYANDLKNVLNFNKKAHFFIMFKNKYFVFDMFQYTTMVDYMRKTILK